MKRLARLHRYLSCLVAPAMLFFAVSGAWQAFRLHESKKDGTYTAPAPLRILSDAHKAEHLKGPAGERFREGQLVVAALFALTAVVGIWMALKVTRPVWLAWLCLTAGMAIPIWLALAAR